MIKSVAGAVIDEFGKSGDDDADGADEDQITSLSSNSNGRSEESEV